MSSAVREMFPVRAVITTASQASKLFLQFMFREPLCLVRLQNV